MSGYLAIVLAVTVPSAINGCVRGYEIYSERRTVVARLRAAADRKAAK
jgi:hypothetical protein